jgi:hypothetical protein
VLATGTSNGPSSSSNVRHEYDASRFGDAPRVDWVVFEPTASSLAPLGRSLAGRLAAGFGPCGALMISFSLPTNPTQSPRSNGSAPGSVSCPSMSTRRPRTESLAVDAFSA